MLVLFCVSLCFLLVLGGISNVLVEAGFDPPAKLALWWALRLGGPILFRMDESVGRQALHAPRAPGRPP